MPADRQRSRPVPSSTYRIQFSKDQTFDQVRELLPYLDALGAGALYASPLLESGAGSNHGYDVVDPTRISAERGGPEGLRALVAAVREHGLGFVLDIVPNHVGVAGSRENPWWWDVLRHGKESAYATYFDIDWDAGPILLPVLDADEEKALSELALSDDGTELRYYEHAAPVAPGTGGGSAQEVHERQRYRFGSWKRGAAELTYRRFFDVSTLAAVRVEDPEVFAATHAEILRWVDEGAVDGLRVDHPDGLSDPGGYARRLRAAIGPDRWLVVEKILGVGEALPASWPVDGTSGYEALREIQGVFVDPDGAGLLTQFAAEHTGRRESLHAAEHAARREVADTILAAEVRRIAALAPGDAAVERAREAVAELLCGFPVYRSYLPEGRAALDAAVSVAHTHRPDLADVLDGLYAAMLADPRGELATRVQQTSGMVMAKGVEDTTFYRWNRFVALNEVGGAPDRFGVSPAEFHAAAAERDAARPRDHDHALDARHQAVGGRPGPPRRARRDAPGVGRPRAALVGAPPAAGTLAGAAGVAEPRRRVADPGRPDGGLPRRRPRRRPSSPPATSRPCRRWTRRSRPGPRRCSPTPSWSPRSRSSSPGSARPAGRTRWARSCCSSRARGCPTSTRAPISSSTRWSTRTTAGRSTGRRGATCSTRLDEGWLPDVDAEGAAKLLVTTSALRLRRYRPEEFTGYRPLPADGPAAAHAVAFQRSSSLVAVATRLPVGLAARGGWGDTVLALPDGAADWHDVVTDTAVDGAAPRLAELLARYPVALLVRPA